MLTTGEVLRNRRLSLGKDLNLVSGETRVHKHFLEWIESDQYQNFDNEIFLTGYLKIYADYLGLNVDKILAIYRRTRKQEIEKKKKLVRNETGNKLALLTPSSIVILIVSLLVFSVFGYLSYQFYNFQRPPKLEITKPANNSKVEQEKIVIEGLTEAETLIEINEKSILVNEDNSFVHELKLVPGANTITVKAIKERNRSKETIQILNITYTPKTPEVKSAKKEEEKVNKITVEVNNQPTWLQLEVDGDQKFAEIVNPGFKKDYKITKSFKVVTGIPENTRILINGKLASLSGNAGSAGTLSCEVRGESVSCL